MSRSGRSDALSLLGLAQRAGALVTGVEAVRHAMRKGEVKLLIVARDGSEAQQRKLIPLARARGVPRTSFGSMNELGAALGAGPLTAIGVTRREFAGEIEKRLGRV